ncbi:carbohydrate kinase family protein [Terracidiphilus gabretensis]|jgi:fructokinase|uniref:carbohydrate kinase family protein n=1 Tax=Terracidiphilus gabretensis TaxID=1577687 RepID=UPI00071BC972|nr:carbohydrate kinase [Terracidiphilus gabretensis]
MKPHLILGIGELLWDLLPEGPRLGGAPANFTVMVGRLGNHAAILSRIGRDDLGRRAVESLDGLRADTEFLQIDASHETGRVTVALKNGQPEYTIHQPAAWDFLLLSDQWVRLAERADAVCFGSLAQRNVTSKQTIQELIAQTRQDCIRIFDVNLRAPFHTGEVVEESLELATVLKMNDTEVPIVMDLLGLGAESGPEADLRGMSERLLSEFPRLRMVAITRGGQGSLLVARDGWHEHPGIAVDVVDTIGAGDAFTAAMTHYLLRGASLAVLNEAGNRWGAWVASQSGAMPLLPDAVKQTIDQAIASSGR